jgi:hypothetical protein
VTIGTPCVRVHAAAPPEAKLECVLRRAKVGQTPDMERMTSTVPSQFSWSDILCMFGRILPRSPA